MRNFIVYAPPIDLQSAGNFMLHFLNSSLNDIGFQSRVVEFGGSVDADEQRDAIVIYPEIIHNNPLGTQNIARYLLNKDGLLWGHKIERGSKDFIFAYSNQFEKNVPIAFFPLMDLEKLQFGNDLDKRELDLIYFGKGPSLKMDFDGQTPYLLITRKWPAKKEILISFLQSCRYFHSADCMTAILPEALLCGATPIIHYWHPEFDKNELAYGELSEVVEMQIEQDFSPANTVKKAQSLRKKIQSFQNNWHQTLHDIAAQMQKHFA